MQSPFLAHSEQRLSNFYSQVKHFEIVFLCTFPAIAACAKVLAGQSQVSRSRFITRDRWTHDVHSFLPSSSSFAERLHLAQFYPQSVNTVGTVEVY